MLFTIVLKRRFPAAAVPLSVWRQSQKQGATHWRKQPHPAFSTTITATETPVSPRGEESGLASLAHVFQAQRWKQQQEPHTPRPVPLLSPAAALAALTTSAAATNNSTSLSPPPIEQIVQELRRHGITTVAIDFDKTLIDIHTGGEWWRDPESLLPHIRPQFRWLIQQLIRMEIRVAICSFSSQADVMRAVLNDIVGEMAAATISIQAFHNGSSLLWPWQGKQEHLHNVLAEQQQQQHATEEDNDSPPKTNKQQNENDHSSKQDDDNKQERLSQILLIDDSEMNVWIAMRNGAHGIWFDPDQPDALWEDLVDLGDSSVSGNTEQKESSKATAHHHHHNVNCKMKG